MTTVSIIVSLLAYGGLVVLAGFRPLPPRLSRFELQRRAQHRDGPALAAMRRQQTIDDVMTLIRLLRVLVMVLFIWGLVTSCGVLGGLVVAAFGLFVYEPLARWPLLVTALRRLHRYLENRLFRWVQRYQTYLKPLRGFATWRRGQVQPHSRQELAHIITQAGFLSVTEQRHMQAALQLEEMTAGAVMSPLKSRPTVSQHDLVGPLLLHELHETGQTIFPVTERADSTIIVGILSITHLLTLEDKTSRKVKQVMDSQFPRLTRQTSLLDCLAALLQEQQSVAVVYDEDMACGLVTLEACWQTILGHQS